LLLTLASAFILRPKSPGNNDILLSQIQGSPKVEGHVPVSISPRKRVAQFIPKHWLPFSSPPTTRKATVEEFEPVSTRVKM
jgi:hypothetical protein